MSGIVLSSAVRQNLLALQDTAAALATTQNDLSTGKKVNSALDNPTNFFTAAGLDNRASDISNLLDGISNGVQVLQAANTGITSLESLTSQAKSIANQALQTSIGYSAKSSVTTAAIIDGSGNAVTASNLLGTGTVTAGATTGTAVTAAASTTPLTASTTLASLGINSSEIIGLNGDVIDFGGAPGTTAGSSLDPLTATVGDLLNEAQTGGVPNFTWSISGGQITINSTSGTDVNGGNPDPVATALGLTPASGIHTQTGSVVNVTSGSAAVTGSTVLSTLSSVPANNSTITVNGKTLTFSTSAATSTGANGGTINIASGTVNDVLNAINAISGGSSSINGTTGAITLNSSVSSNLVLGGTALSSFGLTGGTYAPAGNTLSFAAVGNGTATSVTFGTGSGQVSTLDQLNSALAADNLQATLSSSGALTFTTTNDAASASIGTIGGTAVSSSTGALHGKTASTPVADAASQATRSTLVAQYNAILTQIDNTASDSSYNGVNLLSGDQLDLTFDETGKSKLSITGVNFSSAGLGLAALTSTSFDDNNATNSVLTTLNSVSTTLRSQASALGSNLSVVQTRQDFNTNLINVLQTGSANLTQADINLEAANSQALSTRQSLSVSALSLANQSQQSVLQLLR